ncbi:MAG: rod shape-determining protein MreC [Phycisphaeraceae bacterium]
MLTQRKALVLVTLLLLAFALVGQRWTSPVTRPLASVVRVAQYPAGWIANQGMRDPAVDYRDIDDATLLELYDAERAANVALWEENTRLNEQIASFTAIIEARPIESIQMVEARVGRFNDDPINPTMSLLRGSLQGIKPDDPVAFKSNLIGFVAEGVGPITATATLITRPGFSIEVSIQPPPNPDQELGPGWPLRARVASDGRGRFFCDLDENIANELRPGDEVRVADTIRDNANGLMLGVIETIQTDVGERPLLEDRIIIKPRAPIGPQRMVTVLTELID